LRAFDPKPSVSELAGIIAAEDGYYHSPFITSKPASGGTSSSIDVYQILPALVAAGVISDRKAAQVWERVAVYASVRRIIQDRDVSGRTQTLFQLARTSLGHPWLVATRPWWVEVARTTGAGRSLLPAYYALRDAGYRLRNLGRRYTMQVGRDRGGAGR
jgi:hypothetical protein